MDELENHPIWKEPSGPFKPCALYNPDGDFLLVLWEDGETVAEHAEENLLLYRNKGRVVGCEVKNVSRLIAKTRADCYREELEASLPIYEELIRARFPEVKLRVSPSRAPEGEGPPYDLYALMVPDGRLTEFVTFTLDVLPAQLEARGAGHFGITPCSASTTLKYHLEETKPDA